MKAPRFSEKVVGYDRDSFPIYVITASVRGKKVYYGGWNFTPNIEKAWCFSYDDVVGYSRIHATIDMLRESWKTDDWSDRSSRLARYIHEAPQPHEEEFVEEEV
ncbi:MAG: hypothetical protein QW134_03240 [Nitrososphaeria archaeon]